MKSRHDIDQYFHQPVSVVIYTYANASGLADTIADIRRQDYPSPVEIIVVNDGNDNAVNDFLTLAQTSDPLLRGTFTPHDTRNISRKKLSLTLSIKAASNEVVVLVTSETRIPSTHWLEVITAPFADEAIELVLGYAGPSRSDIAQRLIRRGLRHDMLLDDADRLADALARRAWCGDGDNMAMRRSLFFNNMGYGNSLNLQYGDDDVFVSDTSTPANTAVVISRSARVTTEASNALPRYYKRKRSRHRLMAPYCRRRPCALQIARMSLPWLWLLATLGSLAALALDPMRLLTPPLLPIAASLLGSLVFISLILWLTLALTASSMSRSLGGRRLRWAILGSLLTRALRRIRLRRRAPRSWQQPR